MPRGGPSNRAINYSFVTWLLIVSSCEFITVICKLASPKDESIVISAYVHLLKLFWCYVFLLSFIKKVVIVKTSYVSMVRIYCTLHQVGHLCLTHDLCNVWKQLSIQNKYKFIPNVWAESDSIIITEWVICSQARHINHKLFIILITSNRRRFITNYPLNSCK